jgi:hypothetical protein
VRRLFRALDLGVIALTHRLFEISRVMCGFACRHKSQQPTTHLHRSQASDRLPSTYTSSINDEAAMVSKRSTPIVHELARIDNTESATGGNLWYTGTGEIATLPTRTGGGLRRGQWRDDGTDHLRGCPLPTARTTGRATAVGR